MKLPVLKQAEKYVGLYVVDFGPAFASTFVRTTEDKKTTVDRDASAGRQSCSAGFTAREVAEILDSEKYKDCKVYKIHQAYPDGRIELRGVRREIFQLEAGMFFYEDNEAAARSDFKQLINVAVQSAPPCRANVQLAKYSDEKFVTVIIYPAECDDEVSRWLLDNDYKTKGAAEGGIGAVERYYQDKPEILERHQLFSKSAVESRTGTELLANLKVAVQR